MSSQKISFPNSEGTDLSALLDLPGPRPRAFAIFAHCFTCSKNLKSLRNLSAALLDSGIAVLRFDFTGLGQSDGEFADTNFSSNVDDLLAAAAYLEKHHESPALLVGHSLGGAAILEAAGRIDSAVAVATIGSPSEPQHVKHLLSESEQELREKGEATVNLGGRPFRMKQQFLDDLEQHSLADAVADLRKALLIMHAPLDDVVGIDNASDLFIAAKHPKSFVSLDSADHLLTREEDSRYAGRVLAAWASRYLPASVAEEVESAHDVVATTPSGGFQTDVRMGAHGLIADEPSSVGGTGLGPSPYDLLGAALATCTTMTLQMYAKHKSLDLESVTVRVRHDKVHAEDCDDCESTAGKVDEFRREISMEGPLQEEQRARMLEIADRCPVHRTLHGEVRVRSELV